MASRERARDHTTFVRKVLRDKLGERLAFERTGVRLYEALMVKCQALQGTQNELPLIELRKHRDDEVRHFKLVEQALDKLGADPTAQTPSADMGATASMGFLQVISDPRSTIPQALNALLTAELTDNAGWELLIKLAREHGQDDMVQDFEQALQSERSHAAEVQRRLEAQVLEPA
jgi:ferritin-like metal-binding protein YciE